MGVGLVAHIPHNAVLWGVVHGMQRHGELHNAQSGAKMAAALAYAVQQVGAQFLTQLFQLCLIQRPQGFALVNGAEQGRVRQCDGNIA